MFDAAIDWVMERTTHCAMNGVSIGTESFQMLPCCRSWLGCWNQLSLSFRRSAHHWASRLRRQKFNHWAISCQVLGMWWWRVRLSNASRSSYIWNRWSMNVVVFTTFIRDCPSLEMLGGAWQECVVHTATFGGCTMHASCRSFYTAAKHGPWRQRRRRRSMLWTSGAWEESVASNGMILSQMRRSGREQTRCLWPQLWGGGTWASLVRWQDRTRPMTPDVTLKHLLQRSGKDLQGGHGTLGCLLSRRTWRVSASPMLWSWWKIGCIGRELLLNMKHAPGGHASWVLTDWLS